MASWARVEDLGQTIATNGLDWREDGRDLIALCVELDALRPAHREDREHWIYDSLVSCNQAYGWDNPNQSEARENNVLWMTAFLFVRYPRLVQRYLR